MVATLHNDLYDNGLNALKTYGDKLYINFTQQPTTYAEATSTYDCGYKDLVSGDYTIADGDVSGRKITLAAITGGTVNDTQTAGWWSIVDVSESKLMITGPLNTTQAVTSGNTFSLTAIDIEFPDPTS